MRIRAVFVIIAVTSIGPLAREAAACGHCDEDKVASTYDHSVASRALSQGHHVVFFKIDGPVSPDDATRRAIEAAIYSVRGVDNRSARISLDTLTVSFSFDPGHVSMAAINTQLDRQLSGLKLSVKPLRVMEEPGDLKTAKRSAR